MINEVKTIDLIAIYHQPSLIVFTPDIHSATIHKPINSVMSHTIGIGQQVHNFRKAKGLSQLDLETQINASAGSISKIESNKTTPTKETLFKIAKALKLNKFELDYLIGVTAYPASEEEIGEIIEEYKEYFSRRGVFAYILDERNRLIYSSKDFQKLLGFNESEAEKLHGMMLAEIMLYPKFGINKLIRTDDYEGLLKQTLSRLYYESHFMKDDKYHKTSLTAINSDPIAKEVWKEIEKNPPMNLNIFERRMVKFQILGLAVKMIYSSEMIYSNSRFVLVEYTPTNLVMKLLSKIG